MDILSTILSLVGLVFFVYLLGGAYLLIQDSDRMFYLRKEIKRKNPKLTRLQIKLRARKAFEKEMKENHNVK